MGLTRERWCCAKWALVKQARHEHMSDEFKNRYVFVMYLGPHPGYQTYETLEGFTYRTDQGGKPSGQTLVSQTRIVDRNY